MKHGTMLCATARWLDTMQHWATAAEAPQAHPLEGLGGSEQLRGHEGHQCKKLLPGCGHRHAHAQGGPQVLCHAAVPSAGETVVSADARGGCVGAAQSPQAAGYAVGSLT